MRVAVCSSQSYDRHYLLEANQDTGHDMVFLILTYVRKPGICWLAFLQYVYSLMML